MFCDFFTRFVSETKERNLRSILYQKYKYRSKYFKILKIEYRSDKTQLFDLFNAPQAIHNCTELSSWQSDFSRIIVFWTLIATQMQKQLRSILSAEDAELVWSAFTSTTVSTEFFGRKICLIQDFSSGNNRLLLLPTKHLQVKLRKQFLLRALCIILDTQQLEKSISKSCLAFNFLLNIRSPSRPENKRIDSSCFISSNCWGFWGNFARPWIQTRTFHSQEWNLPLKNNVCPIVRSSKLLVLPYLYSKNPYACSFIDNVSEVSAQIWRRRI